jgi:hypothetical protein
MIAAAFLCVAATLLPSTDAVSSLVLDSLDSVPGTGFTLASNHLGAGKGYLEVTNVQHPKRDGTVSRFAYEVVEQDSWGGYIDAQTNSHATGTHDCTGASVLEVDYFVETPQTPKAENKMAFVRLSVFDGLQCSGDCTSHLNGNEVWYADARVFLNDVASEWKTLQIPLEGVQGGGTPFDLPGYNGVFHNRVLDLSRITGWMITFTIANGNTGPDDTGSSGVILLDNLRCTGDQVFGGNFVSPYLRTNVVTTNSAMSSQTAVVRHELGHKGISAPVLEWTYAVQNSDQDTARYTAIEHVLAGTKQYAVADTATDIRFWYRVLVPRSGTEQLHLRFAVVDSSECTAACEVPANNKLYYGDAIALDGTVAGWQLMQISLDTLLPAGVTIQGYTAEISFDTGATQDAIATGSVLLSRITVLDPVKLGAGPPDELRQSHVATSVVFSAEAYAQVEDSSTTCEAECDGDTSCLYFQTNQVDCFLYGHVNSTEDVTLATSLHARLEMSWMADPDKVGQACTGGSPMCNCTSTTIDCSDRGLKSIPLIESTFRETVTR